MSSLTNSNIYDRVLIVLFCALGLLLSVLAQLHLYLPSYMASAGVGLLGSFLPDSKFYDSKQMIAAIYTGSFAAMCSLELFDSVVDILMLSLLTGISFIFFSPHFKGFGGKLGAIGFVASVAFVSLKGFL